jgi:type IV pilus assembly protein PilN
MVRINLLPWREAERKRRQQEFYVMLAVGLVFALAMSFYVHMYVDAMIAYQNERNAFLNKEIAQLKTKIDRIKDLEKTKASLVSRMQIIQQLQESRPEIVHLFDQLVNTVPEGVYLAKVSQQGRTINLEGRAQSNARVSAYMRNIDASGWLGGSVLKVIEQRTHGNSEYSQFSLVAQQIDQRKTNVPPSKAAGR